MSTVRRTYTGLSRAHTEEDISALAGSAMQGRGIIPLMPLRDTMPQHYRLDPILDFMRLLWSVEHGLERMSKRMGSELGITGPQRLVLRVVGQFPDISAGDLSQIVRLHPSTMTGILQRLTDRGLLERTRDPRDSRRARLRLKPAAARFTRGTRFTVEKAVTQALDDVGPNSVRGARKVLGALARRLNDF